ncbi:hypothetical protein E1176_15575 [Fulvivirga sp. RKSG066]|uniref:hypothetical protein n=1 Tax=Fulvivirga aurantia TaxID=2529383 RepID=UPI0012BC1248|nr:hypothetical protein [Fulvivirga aurantia]MTI22452.1 hypothetical protein [Fulvivirga aurantia]
MIDLQFHFKRFLTIKVSHTYYADNEGRDIKFLPTRETAQLINKLGFLLKQDDSGLHILCDGERKEALHYKLSRQELSFSFWMTCNNAYFRNFTAIPTEHRNSIFYFSNAKEKKDDLQKGEFVSAEDTLQVRPNYFDYQLADAKGKLELKDDEDQVIVSRDVDAEILPHTTFENLPEGKYKLYLNDKEKEKFIAIASKVSQPPLGLVEIKFTEKMKKEMLAKIEEQAELPQYNYEIKFKARDTFWRYMVVPKYVRGIQDATIYSEKKGVSFSKAEEVKLVNGTNALSFSSNTALPLMEYSDFHFQLRKKNGGNANKVLIRRLPVPPIDSIKPETREANSKVFSEIIIYV